VVKGFAGVGDEGEGGCGCLRCDERLDELRREGGGDRDEELKAMRMLVVE